MSGTPAPPPATALDVWIAGGTAAARIDALDGLRGLAISLVVLQHAYLRDGSPPGVLARLGEAGWIGVDLFFTLSGFLITGILLRARETNARRYFGSFYARRTLRIFPLYYALLALVFLVLPPFVGRGGLFSFVTAERYAWLRQHEAWFWLYGVNWLIVAQGQLVPCGLTPLWSLAIEEQFYLVWPTVVRWLRPTGLAVACLLMVAGSFATRVVMHLRGAWPMAMYMATFARLDALALGSLLALLVSTGRVAQLQRYARPFLLGSGALLLGYGLLRPFTVYSKLVYLPGFTLLDACFASLLFVVLSAPARSLGARVFSHPALCFLGRYSYAIYLFHVPLQCALLDYPPTAAFVHQLDTLPVVGCVAEYAMLLGLSSVLALVSWNLFEGQILKLKRYV